MKWKIGRDRGRIAASGSPVQSCSSLQARPHPGRRSLLRGHRVRDHVRRQRRCPQDGGDLGR